MSVSNVTIYDIYSPTNPAVKVTVRALQISATHIQISNCDFSDSYNQYVLSNDKARFQFKIPEKISIATFLSVVTSSGAFSVDQDGTNLITGLITFHVIVVDTKNGSSPVVGATVTYGNGSPATTDDTGLAVISSTAFGALTITKTGHIPYNNSTFKPSTLNSTPYQIDMASTIIPFTVIVKDSSSHAVLVGASVVYNNGTPVVTDVNGKATLSGGGVYAGALTITKASYVTQNVSSFVPLSSYTSGAPYTINLVAS